MLQVSNPGPEDFASDWDFVTQNVIKIGPIFATAACDHGGYSWFGTLHLVELENGYYICSLICHTWANGEGKLITIFCAECPYSIRQQQEETMKFWEWRKLQYMDSLLSGTWLAIIDDYDKQLRENKDYEPVHIFSWFC